MKIQSQLGRQARRFLTGAAASMLLMASAHALPYTYDFQASDSNYSYAFRFTSDSLIPMPGADASRNLLTLPDFTCTIAGDACTTATLSFEKTSPVLPEFDDTYSISLFNAISGSVFQFLSGENVLGAVGEYRAFGGCDECRGTLTVALQPDPAQIPEPPAWATLGLALGAMGWATRRSRARASKR